MTPETQQTVQGTWERENARYLHVMIETLRVRLRQRILWMRHRHGGLFETSIPGTIRDAAADVWLEEEDPAEFREFLSHLEEGPAIEEALAANNSEAREIARVMGTEGRPPAFELLAAQFHLGELERTILLITAATELDQTIGRLYAYLQDDVTQARPTVRLLEGLIETGEGKSVREALFVEAPLRRYALVNPTQDGFGFRVDARVIDYIYGKNRLDEAVAGLITAVPPVPVAPSHVPVAERLLEWLQSSGKKRWHPVNLVSSSAAACISMATAIAERAGLRLHRLDCARLPSQAGERAEWMRLLAREAVLAQLLLYIEVPEPEGQTEQSLPPATQAWIEHLPLFFIISTRARLTTDRTITSIRLPALEMADRHEIWRQSLLSAGVTLGDRLDALVEQFDFGPHQTVAAAQSVRMRLAVEGRSSVAELEDVWEVCREQSHGQLAGFAKQIIPVYDWNDIVAPAELLHQLRELSAQVAGRVQVYQQWGFGRKMSRGCGISALFSGASGTGKTMAAEVVARELRLDLYRVELPSMVSKYIGETEKNLRRVFDAADRCGVILFFDEADALFGRRTEVKDSHDRYANIEVNYLLQRMEEYNGLSILATNRKTDVDRAFLRRLRFLVDFPFPSAEQRLAIWGKAFPPETPLGEIDYEVLSKLEVAGGNIRNIALSAAFLAASSTEAVSMKHLLHAARREYAKMDKMFPEGGWL